MSTIQILSLVDGSIHAERSTAPRRGRDPSISERRPSSAPSKAPTGQESLPRHGVLAGEAILD
jgi:hypothetical protein